MLWVRDLGILALLGVAEAQSLGEVLKLQEPAKDERVGGHTRTKLDELYRQGGVYNGRRILDESFVSEATRAQSGDLPGFDYGYLWLVTPIGTTPAYSAIGLYGQLVVVVPGRELVVAISNGSFPPPPSPEGQLLMVETDILPRLP